MGRRLWRGRGVALAAALLGVLLEPGLVHAPFLGVLGVEDMLIVVVAMLGLVSLVGDPRWPIAFAFALTAFGLRLIAFGLRLIAFDLTSVSDSHAYLLLALTMIVPMLLLAGAALRVVSARRGLSS